MVRDGRMGEFVMGRPIAIVADIPSENPGLGFPEYVEAIADAIRGGEPPQFTIGLYGAWGTGKSSLLKAIANVLSDTDSTVLPVLFDAWRHERSEHIVLPLLYRISQAAERSGYRALTEHLRRVLSALLFSLRFSVAGVGIDTDVARRNWEKSGLTRLDDVFAKPFEELRGLPQTLGRNRVAVLIDDLDRCSPEKVVSLLEAINLIMDVPGFIFVLALDYDVLIKAVATKYPHVSGHEFIEKMVQLPFRVPPLTIGAEDFLGELIPGWSLRTEFPEAFPELLTDVASLGLRANPRQIKRLINSFLLLDRIVERRGLEVDRELMTAMIGLQLRWPDHFRDLQDGILAEDQNPFEPLANSGDDALVRYAARFFGTTPENDALRQILSAARRNYGR
jgi:KAP family P-loop domain